MYNGLSLIRMVQDFHPFLLSKFLIDFFSNFYLFSKLTIIIIYVYTYQKCVYCSNIPLYLTSVVSTVPVISFIFVIKINLLTSSSNFGDIYYGSVKTSKKGPL